MTAFAPLHEKIALKQVDAAAVTNLIDQLNVSPTIATILAARGLTEYDACKMFFRPEISHFQDPFLFCDMERAVARIASAINNKEHI